MELKYPKVTLKRIQDVWDKLGGEEGVDKLLSGEIVIQQYGLNPIIRCVSDGKDLIIPACGGFETLADAGDVFKSGIDSDFKNWGLSKPSKPTGITPVGVHEVAKEADFKTMFTYLSADWEKLCLTEHQIKMFCKKLSDRIHSDGYGTFFLTKKNWKKPATIGNLFVAHVDVYSYGLYVNAYRFEYDFVWLAVNHYRLVIPQLET